MVRFENVGLRYGMGPEVLRDISFELRPGSFHFLTGPSGAGKSSLLRLIYLALRPSRGLINIFGQDVITLPRPAIQDLRLRIGVVFQDFRLVEHLSAFDNVALPLRVAGVSPSRIRSNVSELLNWVGLTNQIDFLPATLSGGQQQRVAIARAVISRPQLLLADEPTGNVDNEIAMRLIYLFDELNKMGTTVIIATHNKDLISRFSYPVIRLEDGEASVVDQSERVCA